jgi:hypothetical protein
MLDGSHQVTNVVAGDAARGGEEAHGFPVTAIEREGNPHPLAIVAADLEAIGARRSLSIAQAAKTTISLAGTEIIDDTMKPSGIAGPQRLVYGDRRHVTWLNAFVTPILSGSAVASTTFCAYSTSCLVCSVTAWIWLRLCSVESSKQHPAH